VFIGAGEVVERDGPIPDLCIVGSGAAGIPLALAFAGTSVQVVLLERGGAMDDAHAQGIYTILPGRRPRLARDPARRCYFGGNTNHWPGNCRPLDPPDFERRDWIPHSGWPMSREEMLPFYERAHAVCRLGDFRYYDIDTCRHGLSHPPLEVDPATLVNRVMHRCPVPGLANLYRTQLGTAENIRVCLHVRATRLETGSSGGAVRAVRVATAEGSQARVRARVFVLAGGGIENARLLLCSRDGTAGGMGNDRDLVGRFFMEHPYVDISLDEAAGGPGFPFYSDAQVVGTTTVWGQLGLSDALARTERVAGLSVWLQRVPGRAPAVAAAARLRDLALGRGCPPDPGADLRTVLGDPRGVLGHVTRRLSRRRGTNARTDGYALRILMEQPPDPRNRVQLSARRDHHGDPCAELVLGAGRHGGQDRGVAIAAEALGLDGRRVVRLARLAVEAGRSRFFWHHMGTTRMHEDPGQGVVDADCRVHGMANLFVAGSSVFPTGGTAPPTLTIVALALRLARHLGQHHL
jgi:choline dehydrogenase-like flavoprotein